MSLSRCVSAISIALGSVAAVSSAADSVSPGDRQSALTPALYIVQADSLNTADKSVVRVNAKVEQEFEIIHSVSAYLTPEQASVLRGTPGVRVYENREVSERALLTSVTGTTSTAVSTDYTLVSTTYNWLSYSPAVCNVSTNTTLSDGTGINAPTFLYQTDYPALVGAD